MADEPELAIVEKLTRERTHDFGRGLLGKHVNPDGPEAAAIIREAFAVLSDSSKPTPDRVRDAKAILTRAGAKQ